MRPKIRPLTYPHLANPHKHWVYLSSDFIVGNIEIQIVLTYHNFTYLYSFRFQTYLNLYILSQLHIKIYSLGVNWAYGGRMKQSKFTRNPYSIIVVADLFYYKLQQSLELFGFHRLPNNILESFLRQSF